MRSRILPLGIDIGATRARIAVAEQDRDGTLAIRAVASRDLPASDSALELIQLIAMLLEEMLSEVGVRERRCVAAIGSPHALLRAIRFPKMSWSERLRAARYEAQRFSPWNLEDDAIAMRVHPVDAAAGVYAIGLVRSDALMRVTGALKSARLRPIAIDVDAIALRRAIQCDAIVDIGAERTTLHTYWDGAPRSVALPIGGACVTRGIATELAIDEPSAERRKRILGCAGAGIDARTNLVMAISEAVERESARATIARIALVGNGARLPGLVAGLEEATGCVVELPVPPLLETDAYPDDVLRAAAPDWVLAASLATWSAA